MIKDNNELLWGEKKDESINCFCRWVYWSHCETLIESFGEVVCSVYTEMTADLLLRLESCSWTTLVVYLDE